MQLSIWLEKNENASEPEAGFMKQEFYNRLASVNQDFR
ncbi:hypothetical protein EMGBS15_16330 [Filimonas sp.]|jgi:hypothetical protein|nr:hypothetical protein EMGBS15_16330 [Filimonas sp.]